MSQLICEAQDKLWQIISWFLDNPASFSAIFAGVALWRNTIQSARSDAQARAAFVAKWLERFVDDLETREIYYKIEYDEFKYDPSTFHPSEEEWRLDKLLLHLSNAALAQQSGLLRQENLLPLQYLARRVISNEAVKAYLVKVSEVAAKNKLGDHPYNSLNMMETLLGP